MKPHSADAPLEVEHVWLAMQRERGPAWRLARAMGMTVFCRLVDGGLWPRPRDHPPAQGTLLPMDLEATLFDLAPRLVRYCVGRAADPALGEEVAQETLTALVARWRRHGPPDSPEAFVFTVARRRLGRAFLRRRLLEPLETLFQERDAAPDPEQRTLARSALTRLVEKLAELPGREREALLLVAAGELDTAGAARLLGISRSALKMRVHRARKRLQLLLEDSAWEPDNATASTKTA